MFHDALLFSG